MAIVVEGVGRDAPMCVNDQGGKQSLSPYRLDLLPVLSLLSVAAVLKYGAEKYGENNWHKTTVAENINHLLQHVFAYLVGDTTDDHLSHAVCRAMFAHELHLRAKASGLDTDLQGQER